MAFTSEYPVPLPLKYVALAGMPLHGPLTGGVMPTAFHSSEFTIIEFPISRSPPVCVFKRFAMAEFEAIFEPEYADLKAFTIAIT